MKNVFAACAAAVVLIALPAHAAVILQDDFNGPTLGSAGATGSGFAVASGGATVSGGTARVGTGGGADQTIYSLDTFDPAGTTLTWIVNQRPTIGAAGVSIGWAKSGIGTCAGCGPEIYLEARNDRTVFDVVDGSGLHRYSSVAAIGGTGPITMSLSLTTAGYSWTISDTDYTVSGAGAWLAGYTLANVMGAAGGNLSAFAATRSDNPGAGDIGIFDSVTVTSSVPEPALWGSMLIGFGLTGSALRRRRDSSRAAGHLETIP